MWLNQNGKELTKNNWLSWIIYPKHHLMSDLPNLMFRRYFWTSSIQNNLDVDPNTNWTLYWSKWSAEENRLILIFQVLKEGGRRIYKNDPLNFQIFIFRPKLSFFWVKIINTITRVNSRIFTNPRHIWLALLS